MKVIKSQIHQIKLAAIVLVCTSSILTSCFKKGPDDPYISLQSRKARVAGEWKVQRYHSASSGFFEPSGGRFSSEIKIENQSYSRTETQTFMGTESKFSSSGRILTHIVFKKNGEFSRTYEYQDINDVDTPPPAGSSNKLQRVETGTWDFMNSANSDYKNKERILISILKKKETYSEQSAGSGYEMVSNYEYGAGNNVEIWHLQELRNNEMTVKGSLSELREQTDSQTGPFPSSSQNRRSTDGTVEFKLISK